METSTSKKQITVDQFAELVFNLMENLPVETDMQIIESVTRQVMNHNSLTFKDYKQFLLEVDGDTLATYWMSFENTSEYFFDRINSQAVTLNMVKRLVEQTIIF
jgi:hypothetical protein